MQHASWASPWWFSAFSYLVSCFPNRSSQDALLSTTHLFGLYRLTGLYISPLCLMCRMLLGYFWDRL